MSGDLSVPYRSANLAQWQAQTARAVNTLVTRTNPTSSVVYVEAYGAIGDGGADDTSPLQAAIAAVGAAGGGVVRGTPGRTYKITTSLSTSSNDVIVDMTGATVTSAMTASAAMYSIAGTRNKVIGGTWKLTGGSANPFFFDFSGTNCELGFVRLLKTPDAAGYYSYFRHTADGFKAYHVFAEGSNGFYVECSDSSFDHFVIIGQAVGGDDGLAIKGLNDSCRNVRISNLRVENLSSAVSIGSEVGTNGAADPNYTKTVGQIDITNVTAKNCYGLLYIKPGGSTPDIRDGTVEGVNASNLTLIDESGTKCERPIAIVAGRGARIRNVTINNVKARARTAGGAGRLVGADVYITSDVGGTAQSSISNVFINGEFIDIYQGQTNAAGRPGYPFTNVASVNRAAATGTFSNIVLDIYGDGSAEAGLVVGTGLSADAVTVKRMHLINVNQTNAAGQGGAYLV